MDYRAGDYCIQYDDGDILWGHCFKDIEFLNTKKQRAGDSILEAEDSLQTKGSILQSVDLLQSVDIVNEIEREVEPENSHQNFNESSPELPTWVRDNCSGYNLAPDLEYHSWKNFFPADLVNRFKKFIWNDCKLYEEHGLEFDSPKKKGRLYAWFGMEPGFGYNRVWVDSQNWTPELREMMETIKRTYSKFEANGCLIAVYPPTLEEDLEDLEGDQRELNGMDFHQVCIITFDLMI